MNIRAVLLSTILPLTLFANPAWAELGAKIDRCIRNYGKPYADTDSAFPPVKTAAGVVTTKVSR